MARRLVKNTTGWFINLAKSGVNESAAPGKCCATNAFSPLGILLS
jgi:hypothetical protein